MSQDPNRCPECDFELMYVKARELRAYMLVGEEKTLALNMTDAIVCTRCGWWRHATPFDHPVTDQMRSPRDPHP